MYDKKNYVIGLGSGVSTYNNIIHFLLLSFKIESLIFVQDFIDELVVEGLLRTVASSLGYLLDETDPYLTQGVLFDVRLELAEPDVIFVPPIDQNLVNNFYDQLVSYVDDIFFQCTLFPRIANHERNLGKKIGKPLSYGNP